MRGKRLAASLLALPLAFVFSVASAHDATHRVAAAGGPLGPTWRWDPAQLEIVKGDKVVWTNPSSTTHHVVPYEGPWDKTLHVEAGKTVTMRFKKPGTYRYRCDIPTHSEMIGGQCVGQCGTITVK